MGVIRDKIDQEITIATANTETIVVTPEIDTKEEDSQLNTKTIEEIEDKIEIEDIKEATTPDLILKIRANPAPMVKIEIEEIDTKKEKREALIMEEVINLHKTKIFSSRTIIDLIDCNR